MSDVLVINTRSRTGELVRLSLERHGLSVYMIEAPSAVRDLPGYLRAVRKGLNDSGAATMIPIFYPEILASRKDDFPGITILAGEADKIMLLDNKRQAVELAESLGIPTPRRFGTMDTIPSFPVVFKRSFGQGGDSVYFPNNQRALDNLLATAKDYLITEFIEGDNVSIDTLRWNSYFKASCYKVLEPKGKGVSTLRESIDSPAMIEYAHIILDSIDYNGICGLDFRMAPDGSLYFLECNPRFSGGLETTLGSGFDQPYEYYSLSTT